MNDPLLLPASSAGTPFQAGADVDADPGTHTGTDTSPSELLLVEGKSAQQALNRIRNRRFQGVFRMQGKIPNPATAKPEKVHAHEHCSALIELLKAPAAREHYQRVVILPDPDVDGAHTAYLLISLFRHYLPEWLASESVYIFRTPLARVEAGHPGNTAGEPGYLYSPEQIQQWLSNKPPDATLSHFKGLASMTHDELAALVAYPIINSPLCRAINPEAHQDGIAS